MTFELLTKSKKKVKVTALGGGAVIDGDATSTLMANKALHTAITVVYSGDANDEASTRTTPRSMSEPVASLIHPALRANGGSRSASVSVTVEPGAVALKVHRAQHVPLMPIPSRVRPPGPPRPDGERGQG